MIGFVSVSYTKLIKFVREKVGGGQRERERNEKKKIK